MTLQIFMETLSERRLAMNDTVFNDRLQSIESAYRRFTEIRLELERSGVWKTGMQYDKESDFYQFWCVLSCRLSQLYLDKEATNGQK
mgnify:CR=1 FL=1